MFFCVGGMCAGSRVYYCCRECIGSCISSARHGAGRGCLRGALADLNRATSSLSGAQRPTSTTPTHHAQSRSPYSVSVSPTCQHPGWGEGRGGPMQQYKPPSYWKSHTNLRVTKRRPRPRPRRVLTATHTSSHAPRHEHDVSVERIRAASPPLVVRAQPAPHTRRRLERQRARPI